MNPDESPGWERQPGPPARLRFGGEGELRVVAVWWGPEGGEMRVVRWELRGAARVLYHWARGQSAPDPDVDPESDEPVDTWVAGVALERRAGPTARWDTVQRQELTATNPAAVAARLHGWEAGLLDRATRLARRTTSSEF